MSACRYCPHEEHAAVYCSECAMDGHRCIRDSSSFDAQDKSDIDRDRRNAGLPVSPADYRNHRL